MHKTLTLITSAAAVMALAVPAVAAPSADPLDGASQTAAATIGAPDTGYTGAGVGVAVVDTGVSPAVALGDQVAARLNVSGFGRNTDGHGHGTFLAGLVVGQDGPGGTPLGVAPDAHVVSVKVADAHGGTNLERILAGLAAIRSAPADLNIKVVVLAIGGPADDVADPIEEALEQMWADGYFVVVASGNDGDLVEPGTSPYLMTVGASDDAGTADPADDTLVDWSGTGIGRDGSPKPDVLAPGKSLVSARIAGSTADQSAPGSRIQGRWFRGSGSSQAAAVVGGAAAVLYEAHPALTPDEVKGRLVETARPLGNSHAGVVDLPAALASDAVANTALPPLTVTEPGPSNEADGIRYRFVDNIWVGRSWAGRSWAGRSWAGRSWAGWSWADLSWDGRSWAGDVWVDQDWAGRSWANVSWDGRSWAGRSWAGIEWNGRSWD